MNNIEGEEKILNSEHQAPNGKLQKTCGATPKIDPETPSQLRG